MTRLLPTLLLILLPQLSLSTPITVSWEPDDPPVPYQLEVCDLYGNCEIQDTKNILVDIDVGESTTRCFRVRTLYTVWSDRVCALVSRPTATKELNVNIYIPR
jgi:hypothetical protein